MSGQLSAFEMAFRWRADNSNFQEIQTSNTRKPYIFCDFPGDGGGQDPLSPPLDPHMNKSNVIFGLTLGLFVGLILMLYAPSKIFQLNRDGSSWVEPVLS